MTAAGEELGRPLFADPDPWAGVLAAAGDGGDNPFAVNWTAGLIRRVVGRAAAAAGRNPDAIIKAVADRLADLARELELRAGECDRQV